jgi:hypothetical protein
LKRTLAPGASPTGGAGSNIDVALDLHFRNISAILDAWERGEEAPTSAPEARKAVAIILAMYQSAKKKGAAVKVSGGKSASRKTKPVAKTKAKKKKGSKRR